MNLAALRRPGAGFVPFVTRAHIASAAAHDDVLALDGGALVKQVEGRTQVIDPGTGEGSRAGLRAKDEVVRLNGAAAAPLDSLARRFGSIPRGGAVRLELRRDGAPVVVEYRKGTVDEGAARAQAGLAARFRAEGNTLGHEVCHQLVASEADRTSRGRAAPGPGYGHDALPDWFDEMAATLCESPAARERRREYLRATLDDRIPLDSLARMQHPVSAAVSVRSSGSRPAPRGDLPVQVLRGEEARRLLRNMNAPLFYAQSLSLGEFISERGGPGALRRLTEVLASGRTLDEGLRLARQDAPRLPGSVAELDAEWLLWFTTRHGP
jgi:hypothetical protein